MYRRFRVRYSLAGQLVEKYADTIAELEQLLVVPRGHGVSWHFKSVR